MQWFKHMSNMRHDRKIRRLVRKYGLAGYGLYCHVLESITESLTTNSPMPVLEDTALDIAADYNHDTLLVTEMMSFLVNQGLLESDKEGFIRCSKVYVFLDTSQTRSKEIRKMITDFKSLSETVRDNPKKTRKCTQIEASKQLTPLSETVRDKSEEENRKEKKRIDSDIIEFNLHEAYRKVMLSKKSYNLLVSEYGKNNTEDYIKRLAFWEKRKKIDEASAYRHIANWMKRDGIKKTIIPTSIREKNKKALFD